MLWDSAYYYNDIYTDTAPDDRPLFVIAAGHYKPRTIPYLATNHSPRRDYQMLYVKNGIFHYLENGIWETAGQGSFVFYRPGEPQNYKYYLKDGADIYWVHFTGSYAERLLNEHNLLTSRFTVLPKNKRYEKLYSLILEELKLKRDLSCELCSLYVQELILTVISERDLKHCPQNTLPPELSKIVAYIEEHYSEDIYIDTLAKQSYMGKSWLIKQFKRYLGVTPVKYLNNIRIEKAKLLLLQTANPISDIAAAVGFSDRLYFSKFFSLNTGLSPTDYRKNGQEK